MKRLIAACRAFVQKYNERGEELPDPRPVEVPLHFKRPMDLHERIRQAVQTEMWSRRMAEQGLETEAEADDFDVGEGDDPDVELSRAEVAYQMAEDNPREREVLREHEAAVAHARKARARAPARGATPPTRVEENVNPNSEIVLTERSGGTRP